mgnify:CR=1 FL=1
MNSSNCSNQIDYEKVILITEINRFRQFLTYKQWQKMNEIAENFKLLGYNPGEFFSEVENVQNCLADTGKLVENYTCETCGGYNPDKNEFSLCHTCRQ